ncbi:MAG: CPBP family glutamic-type intramembrane protease [Verrucomicrobiota bacterium]
MESLELKLTPSRVALLACYAATIILLIPAHQFVLGGITFIATVVLLARDPEKRLRLRLGVLLACVLLLGITDITPDLSNANFIKLTAVFSLVLIVPLIVQRWDNAKIIRYRFKPLHWRKADVIYTILSVPLAWMVLRGYEWGNLALFDNELFRQWSMPEEADAGEIRRLFIGINLVGIWDELFFINTGYALLRSLFSYRVANALQAVLYTAVLFDMAFVGLGVVVVFLFALTQGAMYEKSEGLLWVLIVHLVVDYFLVAFIVQTYYPDYGLDFLWRKGF